MNQRYCFHIAFTTLMILLHSSIINCATIQQKEKYFTKGYGKFEVCSSIDCQLSAQQILKNMNENVNPCENFYEFACGNFGTQNDEKFISTIDENSPDLVLDRQLKFMIDNPIQGDTIDYKKELESYYDCQKIDESYMTVEYFLGELSRNGGWPVVAGENWNETEFTFPYYRYRYTTQYENHNDVILEISNKLISLNRDIEFFQPRDEESEEDTHECLRNDGCKFMFDIVILFGAPRNSSTMDELMDVINFARDYQYIVDNNPVEKVRVVYDTEEEKDKAMKKMNADFTDCARGPVWFDCIYNNTHSVPNKPTQIYRVLSPKPHLNLENLLEKTPGRVQANFFAWMEIKDTLTYIESNMKTSLTSELLANKFLRESDSDGCFRLSRGLEEMKYMKIYSSRNNQEISIMFDNIKETLKKNFRKITWIDSQWKKQVFNDIDDMIIIDNVTSKIRKTRGLLRNIYGEFELPKIMTSTPFVKYTPEGNSIDINTFYFNGTSFKINVPKYLNYAGLGVTIGREMSSLLFNDTYAVPGIIKQRIGPSTGREIINTLMGLELAYSTYGRIFGDEPRLLRLEKFTPQQVFWINAANNMCVKEFGPLSDHDSDHNRKMIRIVEKFSRTSDFKRDFKCSR